MHRRCTGSLPQEERELRDCARITIQNLALLTLALRLCDFKDVSVAVESKHVRLHVHALTLSSPQLAIWGRRMPAPVLA